MLYYLTVILSMVVVGYLWEMRLKREVSDEQRKLYKTALLSNITWPIVVLLLGMAIVRLNDSLFVPPCYRTLAFLLPIGCAITLQVVLANRARHIRGLLPVSFLRAKVLQRVLAVLYWVVASYFELYLSHGYICAA